MTVMVPDLVQPTPDVLSRCECIMADLHAVQDLLANTLNRIEPKPRIALS
jgi:hypothetical protein